MISQSDFFLRSSATNRAEARSNVVTYCGDVHVAYMAYRNFFTGACYHTIIIIIWICLILGYPNLDGQSWSITMFIFDKKRRDPFRFV